MPVEGQTLLLQTRCFVYHISGFNDVYLAKVLHFNLFIKLFSVMIDTFTKPGIKNFFILLFTWYLLITFYTLASDTSSSLAELYIHYSKYSWPNFLLSYTLFVYVIPYYLDKKEYWKLVSALLVTMSIFVGVRYLNNIYWAPDYYIVLDGNNRPFKKTLLAIIVQEFIGAFQFAFVPFALRVYIKWRINEEVRGGLENEKLRAELNSLRYQLNPHFLLNSMNNIYYMSLVKSDQTAAAVMKLSELFRYILYEKSDWVLLKKEIDNLKALIEFQKIRFQDDEIKLTVQISEKENAILVPPLIFMTFLENAFKHGKIGHKKCPIKIFINTENNFLVYRVINFTDEKRETITSGGSGLEMLKKRLFLLYDNNYALTCKLTDKTFFAELKIPI